jgi:glycosyltransferase involved in cell wall biosynthesis
MDAKILVKHNCALVICCTDNSDSGWRWLEKAFVGKGIRFEFARASNRNGAYRAVRGLNLARIRAAFAAVSSARKKNAQMIVAHGPSLAAWCSLFARILRLRIPIIAHTFNFAELPGLTKRLAFKYMLSKVDRLIVFSTLERQLYASVFGLPEGRFDVVRWGAQPPSIDPPDAPLQAGEYICAIGGNARDYRTLFEAAEQLPDIRFVCVVRPHNLKNLHFPANVSILTDLPLGRAMNVLKYSRLMVLPLLHSTVPCGHVTLVAAMHLGKPMVVTDSEGICDYVRNGFNALTVPAGSGEALADTSERLWNDAALRQRLGENGREFAIRECAEECVVEHFARLLADTGLMPAPAAGWQIIPTDTHEELSGVNKHSPE